MSQEEEDDVDIEGLDEDSNHPLESTQFDRPSQISPSAEYPYKPGSIKSIKLVNFMCHESFELNLGPRVNFIIGPNGSGKSALLTAIVVALGGRATTTCRAKRNDEFIMFRKTRAKISIVLHNYDRIMDKSFAFKPDDYGKTITIEKIITKDDPSRLVLKNDKDKKVSERRQELDELLEHFQILINNPICVLNQEISKTFLHSKRPEDKFELFMKATNLEQIEQDYGNAYVSHGDWGKFNESKSLEWRMLSNEAKSCEEKINFLKNRKEMAQNKDKILRELLWGYVRDMENSSEEARNKLKEITDSIEDCMKIVEDRAKKIEHHEEEIKIMKTKIESMNEKITIAQKKLDESNNREKENKKNRLTINSKIDSIKRKLARYTEDKVSLEQSIENEKKKYQDQDKQYRSTEQRKMDIERLEKVEIPEGRAREKSIRHHSNQLNDSRLSLRQELAEITQEVSQITNKIYSKEAFLKRIKCGQDNQIRKYGDHAIKLRELIDDAFRQRKFKKKPLGPLGFHLKVKTAEIAAALEHVLGKNAHAFTCDNNDDAAVLKSLYRKLKSSSGEYFKEPPILTRPFSRRHDVSRFKAVHGTYKTILDYLEIENEAVHNCIVDRCGLESILFIPDYKEAETLMIDQRAVPQNTRCAYTKDCYVLYPKTNHTGYRAFANNYHEASLFSESNTRRIQAEESELVKFKADLRVIEQKAKCIQESIATHDSEYNDYQKELKTILADLRNKEEQLLDLKTEINREPREVAALEEELEQVTLNIANERANLEIERESLTKCQSDLGDIEKEKLECKKILTMHEKERAKHLKCIEDTQSCKRLAMDEIKEQNVKIEFRNSEKEKHEKKLNESLEKLARSMQATNNCERPNRIRKTDDIQEELRKLEALLRVEEEESRDPEELLESLKKRMKEIECIHDLKNTNLSNYRLTTKSLDQRKAGFLRLRDSTVGAVATTFATVMRAMKMLGEIQIHFDDVRDRNTGDISKKARTLHMKIDTNYISASQRVPSTVMSDKALNSSTRASRSQPPLMEGATPSRPKRPRTDRSTNRDSTASEKENDNKMTDARSLSGGERSFSTVAFVLALWHHCTGPFKLMDEIDVFMDMVTRRISYNALIRFAELREEPGQFIFFSPLELPKFDNKGNFVRVFEMPIIVRKDVVAQDMDKEMGAGGNE